MILALMPFRIARQLLEGCGSILDVAFLSKPLRIGVRFHRPFVGDLGNAVGSWSGLVCRATEPTARLSAGETGTQRGGEESAEGGGGAVHAIQLALGVFWPSTESILSP